MAARRRHRYGRRGQSYKVILDDGSEMFVGASEFLINKQMGNLVCDRANPRVARARKWLRVRVDETTGQLVFESTQKKRPGQPVRTTNRLLLEEWLRADPTLTRQQARQRMLFSLPRVLTETVCLY